MFLDMEEDNYFEKGGDTMSHKGLDYETVILLKLGAMEGQLRAFMSSLEEPTGRKGRGISKVEAPADGEVVWWYWDNHASVEAGDPLCEFKIDQYPPRTVNVPSPAKGKLFKAAWPGHKVRAGALIATVEPEYALV